MKRYILVLLLLFCGILCYSQRIPKYNKVINFGIYQSYYSNSVKAPSFVIYKLYKGGGDYSRNGMIFKSICPHFEYKHSGYDRGHLAPAEDFAYDYELLERTFNYVNVIPQEPKLNRGPWSKYERLIRNYSQRDSIIIICGGANYKNYVPGLCWKIVYSLSTHKLVYAVSFNNDKINYKNNIPLSLKFVKRYSYTKVKNLYKKNNKLNNK